MIPGWQRAALDDLQEAFEGPLPVMLGAMALAIRGKLGDRQTEDIDLAVRHPREAIEAALLPRPAWHQLPRQPHRWIHAEARIVDILPVSEADLSRGEVDWGDGLVMGLQGFGHLLRHAEKLDGVDHVLVGHPCSIALLKMGAWLDSPARRRKDLGDIADLLDRYVGPEEERLWSGPAADAGLFHEQASAWLLGQDLGANVETQGRETVRRFLARLLREDDGLPLAWMAAEARGTLRRDRDRSRLRLSAFQAGFKSSEPR